MFCDRFFKDDKLTLDWEYIDSIPEFAKLKECQQNPVWHGEGTAYEHTRRCIEALENIVGYGTSYEPQNRVLKIAVLFHDIGKGVTTTFTKGNWHSYGHEIEGEKITRRILWNEYMDDRESVCKLVRWHMDALNIFNSKNLFNSFYRLATHVDKISDLYKVKLCDILGSDMQNQEIKNLNIKQVEYFSQLGMLLCDSVKTFPIMDAMYFNGKHCLADKKGIPTVVMMIGLPGSGKNTYIDEKYAKDGVKPWVILSRDDIRYELGFCGKDEKVVLSSEKEEIVSEVFNERLVNAVKEKKNVVINNINLKRKYRDGYKELLKTYNVWYEYVYMEAPTLEDNIERRKGQISAQIFEQMIGKFDFPSVEEYQTLHIYKQKKDDKPIKTK